MGCDKPVLQTSNSAPSKSSLITSKETANHKDSKVTKSIQKKSDTNSISSYLKSVKSSKQTIHKTTHNPNSFYVATTGSDKNKGSFAHPWATMQHAVNVVPNGSTIYLLSGSYHQRLLIRGKGNSQNAGLTITNAPHAHAIIDGTGLANHDGGLITIEDSRGITIKGLEIRNFATNSAADTPMGIEVTGSDTMIQLIDNHIHDIKTTVSSDQGNAHGIGVYGNKTQPITQLKITGNQVAHLRLGLSESIAINGNVDGFSVTGNIVHDNNNIGIDAIGFEGTAPKAELDRARDGVISGNTVYNISSYGNPAYGKQYAADGIYVDGGTHITITQNHVFKNDFGIELASEHHNGNTSQITMSHNWIYNNRDAGLAMGGYDNQRGSTFNCVISHNTFYHNDTLNTGDGQVYFAYDVHNVTVTYNVIDGVLNDVLIGNPFSQNSSNTLNHNDYYSQDGLMNVQFEWKKKTWTGFSTYQKGIQNDASSVFAKPMFINASSGNLHQTPKSESKEYGA